ncbi:uncharacterized protein [Panulirus ornatus]|uniref:uncharacterized protein n=1 Tax=Panulirus ornatus TaxID=150431 RepID=UPI003A8813D8
MEHQDEVLNIEIASVSGTSESQPNSLSVGETSQPSDGQVSVSQDQKPFQNLWPLLERYLKLSCQDKDNNEIPNFKLMLFVIPYRSISTIIINFKHDQDTHSLSSDFVLMHSQLLFPT